MPSSHILTRCALRSTGGLPQNATRAEIEAWAAKNLGGQQHGGGGANGGQQGQLQSQHGSGGGNGYQLAEAQLKQFQEAFANAERERKLRTAGVYLMLT